MTRAARMGIGLGWALLVVVGARGADLLLQASRRQGEELAQKRERLARLEGWLEAEDRVAARRKEVMGRLALSEGKEIGWAALQGLQEAAQAQGLSITDLRPSQVKGQGKKKLIFRVDVKLEGDLAQVDKLLQELPQALPGVRLENFQLVPQESDKAQTVMRLEWVG